MFLKFVTTIVAFFFVIESHAANYYFSANGNDSYTSTQAKNSSTPWKTITKLNSYFPNINPGDSILFKCGETFAGTITLAQSGTAASPIVISSYGTGSKPVISGFAAATGWVNLGGGIYQANCPSIATTVNIVTLNGVSQPMGRFPNANAANSGYLNIDSYVGSTQITSSQLNTSVNWTGAEVVIRKNHWIIDRATITSNTSNVINYSGVSIYQPANNFGFFVQNNPNTLDQFGEWYFDPGQKKIMMYWGSTTPSDTSVLVGSLNYLVYDNTYNYITINGITFTGANSSSLNINNAVGIQIKNSNITSSGGNGIKTWATTGMVIQNTNFQDNNNDGIYSQSAINTQFTNNTVTNIGVMAGMGQSGNSTYEGVIIKGQNNTITNNKVQNVGYSGIEFDGDSTIIKNNFVTNFTLVKDDGGGIYTWSGNKDSLTNNYGRILANNIVVNSGSAPNGTTGAFEGCSDGIYLDDNATGISITGNTVASCVGGIFMHNVRNIVFSGNTLFNNGVQLLIKHDQTKFAIKNNTIQNNIIFSEYKTQPTLSLRSIANDIGNFAVFNNNIYSNIIDNIFPINAGGKMISLKMWQNTYGKDLNSTMPTTPIPYYEITRTAKRSKFTNSSFPTNINGVHSWSVNGNFKIAWDNPTKLDSGALKGSFSFISGATNDSPLVTIDIGTVNANFLYKINFSLIGNKTCRRMKGYLRNTNSPYSVITETQYATIDTARSENTFIFAPTTSSIGATLVFEMEDEDLTVWLDNIKALAAEGTLNDPNNNILFAYNATTANTSVNLAHQYSDLKNIKRTGSIALAPFTSTVLLRNLDTLVTAPPIIYDAPNTLKDITAFNPIQKSATISVYPNPASEYLMLNFNDSSVKDLNIKIMNTNGDIILSQKVQVMDNSYQVNFGTKPRPGCYFIQLSGSGISQTTKVIII